MPPQSTKGMKRRLSPSPLLDPSISDAPPKKEGGAWLGVEPPSGHQDVPPPDIPPPQLALIETFVREGNHDEAFSEECSPGEFEAIKDAAEDGRIGPDSERIRLEYLGGKLMLDDLKGKMLILRGEELVAATPFDKTSRYLAVDTAMDEETGKTPLPPGQDTHTDTINFAKHWFIRDALEQDSMEETFFSIIPKEIIAIIQKNIELDNAKERPNDTLGADQKRVKVVRKRTLDAFKASVELQGLPVLKKRKLR
ncbi:unnamed protein product [Cyclocybe aegerita]|uniref:Uncharacterized protein n=1 Tax=Cyclocybe aegerita TaxID=1973307 RepID=A0A8S0VQ72_CYCAE|nr:unnamed protein product [Cyclocybe aegerita]